MNRIFCVQHSYHLELMNSISETSDKVLLISNADEEYPDYKLPFFETLSVKEKIKLRRKLNKIIDKILTQFDTIFIFGCQDLISWTLYLRSIKAKKNVEVIADNLEFFLRPSLFKSQLKIRSYLKSIFYGILPELMNGKVGVFGERFIYDLNCKPRITNTVNFYDISYNPDISVNSKELVFVSQPYYLDYNIDLDRWLSVLKDVLSKFVLDGQLVKVYFHQRDSKNFKEKLLLMGFEECENISKYNVIGIFSTLLFQEALSGKKVYSTFTDFEDLFPVYYSNFIKTFARFFEIDLAGNKPWKILPDKFRILHQLILDKKNI